MPRTSKIDKPISENDFEAMEDFGTLKRAREVMADKKRMERALKYGEQEAKRAAKAAEEVRGANSSLRSLVRNQRK